jgi:hypothetical protein
MLKAESDAALCATVVVCTKEEGVNAAHVDAKVAMVARVNFMLK